MNRKQIGGIIIVILATTVTGILLTATMPVWVLILLALPRTVRDGMMESFQSRMAREMTKFMFSTRRMGKQLA